MHSVEQHLSSSLFILGCQHRAESRAGVDNCKELIRQLSHSSLNFYLYYCNRFYRTFFFNEMYSCLPRERESLWRRFSFFFSLPHLFSLSVFLFLSLSFIYFTLVLRITKSKCVEDRRTYNRLQPRHITKFDIDYNNNYFLTTRSLTRTYISSSFIQIQFSADFII